MRAIPARSESSSTRTHGPIRAGAGPAGLDPVHDREIRLSVDGRHPGLLEEDRQGNEHVTPEPTSPGGGRAADHRALSKLPTDPDEMRDRLYEVGAGEVDKERPDQDYAAFVLLGDLIRESLMPPEVSAALYRAAARIPGVTLVRHVKDSAGREGVAVTRGSGDGSDRLIFDPKTYAFLGERQLDAKDQVTGGSAILERTVVDKAGERP
ncbi:CU044_5270 family protein [Streptomyces sp. NPDC004675]|uniref:CU044_5270 family protein n=1 Tax=Streptomyces sp. NPDC004675 TaxID=3154286 RepID=UPI0033AE652D